MSHAILRLFCVGLVVAVAACNSAATPSGPAGVPSSSDVNPITGSRGGSATSR